MTQQPPIRLSIHDEDRGPRLLLQDPELPSRRFYGGLKMATSRELSAPMRRAITIARQAIGNLQEQDGHVVCKSLSPLACAEWLLAAYWLNAFDREVVEQMADQLIALQNPSGGWSIAVGGADNISTSILIYLALKLAGTSANDETMTAARRYLIASGGIQCADARARRYLALYGQIPFPTCDQDENRHFSHLENRAWKTICQLKATRQLAPHFGVGELLLCPVEVRTPNRWIGRALRATYRLRARYISRSNRDHSSDRNLEMWQWRGILWNAIQEKSQSPTFERCEKTESFHRLIELVRNQPERAAQILSSCQPRKTALALEAIVGAGISSQANALRLAAKAICAGPVEASHYDAAVMLRSLCRFGSAEQSPDEGVPPELQLLLPEKDATIHQWDVTEFKERLEDCRTKLRNQLTDSQLRDGSWQRCPYATAYALGALAADGNRLGNKQIDQAIRFLRRVQKSDGSWLPSSQHFASPDASGCEVGAIATTAEVLLGCDAVGLSGADPALMLAAGWLRAHQQPGGGWGECGMTAQGYLAGEGPSSLFDTAVAVLALSRTGYGNSPAVGLGIDFLLESEFFADAIDSMTESDFSAPLESLCMMLRALCEGTKTEDNHSRSKTAGFDAAPTPTLVRW
ncbi:MAG TPA: prenyltransferase/squalene oxidase repeat-containing protein [Pirellulales bacterium]|nr:prenyltransferase/squalene oxidase repeat-containing protein [Pirellulales bacterium]